MGFGVLEKRVRIQERQSVKPIPMKVTPIPGEPLCYLVQSESRSDVKHRVDLQYREEPWHKPVASCGCERMMAAHDATCKHILRVIEYEQSKQTETKEKL